MADKFTKDQRYRMMAAVRKFGNASTEIRLMSLFRQYGIKGWRRHLDLPGRPDFTFRRERVVVFVDGCFWHRCSKCGSIPDDNRDYWELKLRRNVSKDREANRALRAQGWRVIRVWEHVLRQHPTLAIRRVLNALAKQKRKRAASKKLDRIPNRSHGR